VTFQHRFAPAFLCDIEPGIPVTLPTSEGSQSAYKKIELPDPAHPSPLFIAHYLRSNNCRGLLEQRSFFFAQGNLYSNNPAQLLEQKREKAVFDRRKSLFRPIAHAILLAVFRRFLSFSRKMTAFCLADASRVTLAATHFYAVRRVTNQPLVDFH
jgi:hypothetical protein